jgi:hypothetical protein
VLPLPEVVKTEPAGAVPVQPIPDSQVVNAVPNNNNSPKIALSDSVKSNTAVEVSTIKKMSESVTAEARFISYLVQDEAGRDTIQVIIPVEEISTPAPVARESSTLKDSTLAVSSPDKKEAVSDAGSPKFIDIELTNPNTTKPDTAIASKDQAAVSQDVPAGLPAAKLTEVPVREQVTTLKMINSDCKSTAGEADFLKTRKKMISQKSEDDMISVAQKLFRQKCYSTEQVRNLSVLLLKQESKYKFFDFAYSFVYDSSNFRTLESELTDAYFLSRFRAMIRN